MSRLDTAALIARIDELLALRLNVVGDEEAAVTQFEVQQAAHNLVAMVYGPDSPQAASLALTEQTARARSSLHRVYVNHVHPVVQGTLRAMRADLQAGIVGNLRLRAVGEVVADFLALAKEALSHGTNDSKNVAAVLTAAAFEDTIRKMGETLASIHDRRPLADVLAELKKKGVLEGATFTTAQSYLKFRNDALHADFDKVQEALVASCIGFVEVLVMRHFS